MSTAIYKLIPPFVVSADCFGPFELHGHIIPDEGVACSEADISLPIYFSV